MDEDGWLICIVHSPLSASAERSLHESQIWFSSLARFEESCCANSFIFKSRTRRGRPYCHSWELGICSDLETIQGERKKNTPFDGLIKKSWKLVCWLAGWLAQSSLNSYCLRTDKWFPQFAYYSFVRRSNFHFGLSTVAVKFWLFFDWEGDFIRCKRDISIRQCCICYHLRMWPNVCS